MPITHLLGVESKREARSMESAKYGAGESAGGGASREAKPSKVKKRPAGGEQRGSRSATRAAVAAERERRTRLIRAMLRWLKRKRRQESEGGRERKRRRREHELVRRVRGETQGSEHAVGHEGNGVEMLLAGDKRQRASLEARRVRAKVGGAGGEEPLAAGASTPDLGAA